ncbi:MAG TPA: outer membrane protein assembly factor BamE, partial [Epsilonproteobacteria bacterium]|nr:outer membrane protein assembly factor BamE [Campylobacterota bacterium]
MVWPELDKAFTKQGIYPSKEALDLIRPGHTKKDLYALFGPPHQQEGFFRVRELEYIFKFRQPKTNEPKICQFKVIFDKDYLVQSYFWNPPGCGESKPQVFTLDSELLFDFDKFDRNNISQEGKAMLDSVAKQLVEAKSTNILVTGYAD